MHTTSTRNTGKTLFQSDYRSFIVQQAWTGGTGYLALRSTVDPTVVIGAVVKTGTHRVYGPWYKIVAEDMGPFDVKAPRRVLDALTPTSNEYAMEWRRECRSKYVR